MEDSSKKDSFYLGKGLDPIHHTLKQDRFLYPSKNFTTHAICLGMTGSGKTGLGIVILEEAGLNQIPAIIIDPKGDLGNLLLTFPDLSANEFLPWVDEVEAERKGISVKDYAQETANSWKEGLSKWDEKPDRIQKLKEQIEMTIYTPANRAGVPISILSSFKAPSKEIKQDEALFRDRINALASSILELIGVKADPVKSREHILLSTIIEKSWQADKDLDLAKIIQQIQKPPFRVIGVLDVDTFYSPKERLTLSISLNNLLASPGFQIWLEGQPLDIQQLLYSKEGKPRFAIISIAHLSDSERMFFVTLLLNEIISWMRNQAGTSHLRALLYMDEIFGYFPPTAMPSSKIPMLTLLKQARAYGLGIVLATQNPVDIDYKGLSNCGTWFIGKLQTQRDRTRVCEGLKIASNGELEEKTLNQMLSLIGNRTFLMRSIYEKEPILFTTRWTLCYLRGPLTLNLIKRLSKTFSDSIESDEKIEKVTTPVEKPLIPSGIEELFLNDKKVNHEGIYRPLLMGLGKLHFVDAKTKIDEWQTICLLAHPDSDGKTVLWQNGEDFSDSKDLLEPTPLLGFPFATTAAGLLQSKNYPTFEKEFINYLYQNETLTLYHAPSFNQFSKNGESESTFKDRLKISLEEKRDEMIRKVKMKYEDKIAILRTREKNAQEKLDKQQKKAFWQKIEAFLSFLSTLLGALVGRKITKRTISDTGTTIRRAGKIGADYGATTEAEENYANLQKQVENLELEMQNEVKQIESSMQIENVDIEKVEIRPRKSDLSVNKLALVWYLFPL